MAENTGISFDGGLQADGTCARIPLQLAVLTELLSMLTEASIPTLYGMDLPLQMTAVDLQKMTVTLSIR